MTDTVSCTMEKDTVRIRTGCLVEKNCRMNLNYMLNGKA